jgi:outer membrane protein assembly factor BamB
MPSRRDLLAALGAGAVAGLAGCSGNDCSPVEPTGTDWPQPGGDAGNTAAAPDLDARSPVGERWRAPAAGGSEVLALAGVAVDSDRVLALGRTDDVGFLTAFDTASGEQADHVRVPRRIAAPPVVVDGHTAVVVRTDAGTELRLLDGGEVRERHSIGEAPATPRTANGTTLFGGDASGAFAYERGEGRRWRRDFGDEREGGAVTFSPAVDGDAVYVTVTSSSDRGIDALDRGNGEVLWSAEGPRAFQSPVRVGSLLLVPVDYELLAFDAATGERRWSTPTPADRRAFLSPAGRGQRLAVSDGWAVHALDRETGDLGWSVEFEGVGRPIVIGDTVVVSDGTAVVALDLADGSERWRLDRVSLVAPLANGVVVRRDDELVACTACEN